MSIAATGSPMPDERHCVLNRTVSSPDRPRWIRRVVAGTLGTTMIAASMSMVVVPASAAEEGESTSVVNERLPRVPEDGPVDGGLLPWTTKAANDMQGFRASAYTGTYYDDRFEQYRLCVVQREGGGSYTTTYRGFVGAYQFGTAYNSPSRVAARLRPELVDTYGNAAARELDRLAATPIYQWNRFWQDAAFWTTFNRGAGWRQWSSEWGANWHCDHRPGAESGWPNPSRYNYSAIERGGWNEPAKEYLDQAASSTRSKAAEKVREKYGRAPAAVGTPRYSKWLARKVIKDEHGWGRGHFKALKKMWFRESNWRYEVVNWQGPWYGLGQVNGPYIASRGYSIDDYRTSPYIQIRVGAEYIEGRYGSPKAAWTFWQANGWY